MEYCFIVIDQFREMIFKIIYRFILDADIFYEKLKNNKLNSTELCVTFDDAIKCQMDIALPVLEDFKIKSFFFVYTSIFEGNPDQLEVFRYFRMNYFEKIDDFYKEFYEILNKDLELFFTKNNETILHKKSIFPHYSIEESNLDLRDALK